jgi:general secretion pathway protein C
VTPEVLRSPVFWARALGLLVAITLGLHLAHLTWRLVGWNDGRERVYTPESLPPVGAPGGTGGALASLLRWSPFGGGGPAGDLPEAAIGFVLKGIVYAPNPEASSALVQAGAGPLQTVGVGGALGSAVIEAIEPHRLVLNNGGRREALSFGLIGAAPAVSPAAPAAGAPPPPPAAAPTAAAAAALASASPIATAQAAAQASNAPVAAPSAPTPPPGMSATSSGYVVGADAPAALLRAGLQPGDVIRSLNGQALGDPAQDRRRLQRAAQGGRARVEVVRNGQTVTLTLPLS